MTEVEAARFLLAGLELLRDALPDGTTAGVFAAAAVTGIRQEIEGMDAPPWTPEPGPDAPVAWSLVACGDEVLAPNGQWYRVTGMARVGQQVIAQIETAPGTMVNSPRVATDKVQTRRGAVGQAMDVLLAGGLELELIGASK